MCALKPLKRFLLFVPISFIVSAPIMMAQSRLPNIVYIFTDQQTASAMSCSGNRDIHTPNIDRIAAKGMVFDRAYCTYPLCGPSRASMMTGLMPHQMDIRGNSQAIPEEFARNGLGNLLSDAGYQCVYGGKWHLHDIELEPSNDHGFRRICGFNDNTLADSCIEFLANRDKQSPFFLIASFDNPHNICEWARNEILPWGPVDDNVPIRDCPNLPSNFAIPAFEPDVIRKIQSANQRAYPVSSYTPDDWRKYRHAYYRLVEKVDGEIGKILDALEKEGLINNTLIVFSSDHGDGNGAHQWNQKSIMYEESIRVPLVVKPPGKIKAEGSTDAEHLVSIGLDLLPTICDYANVQVPENLTGLSLKPVLAGERNSAWRDTLFVESYFSDPGTSVRAAVTIHYKYVVYSWGKYREQLFDLKKDEGELVNLSVENRYNALIDQFRQSIYHWSVQTRYNYHNHYSHPGKTVAPGHPY